MQCRGDILIIILRAIVKGLQKSATKLITSKRDQIKCFFVIRKTAVYPLVATVNQIPTVKVLITAPL